jgi:hypothetical protein
MGITVKPFLEAATGCTSYKLTKETINLGHTVYKGFYPYQLRQRTALKAGLPSASKSDSLFCL